MGNWRAVPDSTVRAFLHQRHQPWTKDAPIPKEQAMLEACLILVLDTHGIGERDLAERWGRSRNFVRAILKAAAEEMTSSEVPGWKVPKRTTGPTSHGTTTSEQERDVAPSKGTKKVPEEYQEGTKKVDRARSICREEERRGDPPPPTPPSRGESVGSQQQGNNTPHQTATPNAGEPQPPLKPPHAPTFSRPMVAPPPEQLADRGAFVARWNLHAEAFYPGQPSQRWEATTLAGRRGHTGGFFTSAKEDAREQPMLEHGDHLLPMLDRYAAVCRGEYGERRPFERRDFEAPRMLAALHLWVTTGTAPFWARPAARPEPTRFAGPAVELLDNDWLLEAARQEGGGT